MKNSTTIAVLGSHSALDVCRGAKDEGFRTLVIAEHGRERTYNQYYRSAGATGCVDECLVLPKFADILTQAVQQQLRERGAVFVPNRSFEVYLKFDYTAIERTFDVPIFGNKYLLKIEERNRDINQYTLLKNGNIRYPLRFPADEDIDRLVIVKVAEKERPYERAFFLAESRAEYRRKAAELLKLGRITEAALAAAVIEEFIVGTPVNFNFFYSPLTDTLELLGTDMRRQTNLDGILRMPAAYQAEILDRTQLTFEEAGHVAVTVLESMLEPAFALGERFVAAARSLLPPGVIGPFALQSIVTSGPPRKDIVVVDVSPRMPGSPGITATPYSSYRYGHPVSAGHRVAMEIKHAQSLHQLEKVVT